MLVPSLQLPQSLPSPAAIASTQSNEGIYIPDVWELEYRSLRYLEQVSLPELETRHRALLRNLTALTEKKRDGFPIQSGISSWYWFKKEHQTRLEFFLRGHSIELPNIALYVDRFKPAAPRHPYAGDILFRYGKQMHLKKMLREGVMRLGTASSYATMEGDDARRDIEAGKKSYLSGRHTKVTTAEGRDLPLLGNVTVVTSMPEFLLFCVSCDWDAQHFDAFGGSDSCLIIRNVEEFKKRLEAVCALELGDCHTSFVPVQYFDPYHKHARDVRSPAITKDFSFAYQQEFRFVCISKSGQPAKEAKFLTLGPLDDMAELYDRDGKKLAENP